jgi:mannose-1-phosphate guanylyltransferase
MVLCAGLGTRLRPLTLERPKPLVPIGDRPLLAHIALCLEQAGFDSLVVNVHHLPEAFARVHDELSLEVKVVHEPKIRGTAGGIAGARSQFGPPPIVVWNGDILAEPPLAALTAAADRDGGLALAAAPRAAGEGTVGVGGSGEVVRLRGERFGEEVAGGDYIGVAALGARCLAGLPDTGCLIGDWALPELRAGGRVEAVTAPGGWSDSGDLAAYLALNFAWLAERGLPAFRGDGASMAPGVTLTTSVVGAGARVDGSGLLDQVVVWPGAHATAPLARAVVTSGGRVVRLLSG